VRVFDAAVEKAYQGGRSIAWTEVLAGEKAYNETGDWLPDETVDAFGEYLVGIKGPLTVRFSIYTPVSDPSAGSMASRHRSRIRVRSTW
jgi:isocitrate dehydrogenase